MTDLNPGRVRVFICEECGEAFLGSVNAFDEGYHVRRYDGCDHDCGPITERILADPDVVRRETIEECKRAIRSNCGACGGTGIDHVEGGERVTHEMAIDAGMPELEGSMYNPETPVECEYCGRPIDALSALADAPRETESNGGG